MKSFALLCVAAAMLSAEYTNVEGRRVYYEVSGTGPQSIVFIHGWTCDSSVWRLQKPALQPRFRVVTIDLPGHGRSDKPEITYDLKLFARAVEAVMDAAHVDRAVLAGHSMGTPVARQVAADHPQRVIALISIDGAIFRSTGPEFDKDFRAFADSMAGPDSVEIRRKFIERMFTDAATPELRKEILDMMLAAPPQVAASAMGAAVLSNVWSQPLAIPALAVNRRSRDDRNEKFAREMLPKLEYHEIQGAGHFLHMEKPYEVNRLMLGFLTKVTAR